MLKITNYRCWMLDPNIWMPDSYSARFSILFLTFGCSIPAAVCSILTIGCSIPTSDAQSLLLDVGSIYSIRMLDSYNRMLTLLSPITPNIRMLDNLIRMLSSYSRMLDFQMPDAHCSILTVTIRCSFPKHLDALSFLNNQMLDP